MPKSELDYANDYFKIYKSLKETYDRKVIIINLLSSIEELSKFIYISLLKNCSIRLMEEQLEKYGIMAFHRSIKRIYSDIDNLYRDHEFKYYFFLFFYSYFSSQLEKKEIVPDTDAIIKMVKRIIELRKIYLSNIEESKIPEEEVIQLSEELEQKLEFILNQIKSNKLVLDESQCKNILLEWQSFKELR